MCNKIYCVTGNRGFLTLKRTLGWGIAYISDGIFVYGNATDLTDYKL